MQHFLVVIIGIFVLSKYLLLEIIPRQCIPFLKKVSNTALAALAKLFVWTAGIPHSMFLHCLIILIIYRIIQRAQPARWRANLQKVSPSG